jgi:hypothetical protein
MSLFSNPVAFAALFLVIGFLAGLLVASLAYEYLGRRSANPPAAHLNPAEPGMPAADHLPDARAVPPETAAPRPAQPAGVSSPPDEWLAAAPPQAVAPPPVKKPSMNPVDVLIRSVQADAPKIKPRPFSIAAQIDEILQEMLPNSELAGREVRLEEQPDFGLVVWVDGNQYDGVDVVPDLPARALIKKAIAEWQKRSAPR